MKTFQKKEIKTFNFNNQSFDDSTSDDFQQYFGSFETPSSIPEISSLPTLINDNSIQPNTLIKQISTELTNTLNHQIVDDDNNIENQMTLEPSFNQPEIDLSMKEESIPKEDNDSIKEKELGSKDNELMIKEDNEDNERNKLLDRDDIIDLKEIEMNIEKRRNSQEPKKKIDSIKTSQYISKDTKDVNSIKTYHRKHSKDIIENTNEHIIDEIDTDQQLLNLSKIDKEVDIKDTIKDIPLNGEVSRSFLNEITNRKKEKEQQFNNTVIVDKHLHSNIQSLTDIDDNTSLLSIVPFGEDRKDISSTTFQSKMDELSLNDNTFFNTNQNIDENDTSLLSIVPFGNNRLPPSDISTTIPTNTILTTTIPTNTQNLSSSIEKVHSNNIQNEHEQPIQNENEQQSIQNENEQQSIQNEQTSLLSIVPFGENRISTTDISKFETNHQTIDESNTINKPMDEIPFQPFQNINSSEISIHDKQILNDSKEISIHNDKQTLNDLEEKQPFISTQTINNSTSKYHKFQKH
ncbi:hypothetical protein QTN25_009985 [Entamoeba marina]